MLFKNLRALFVFIMFACSYSAYADTPGGGSGNTPSPANQNNPDLQTQLAALLKRNEELAAAIEELKKGKGGKPDPKPGDDDGDDTDGLREKARKEEEAKKKRAGEVKEVERAMKFNLTIDQFTKENKDFLPPEIDGILKQAAKENYDTELDRASAMKAAIVQSYYSIQANLDALTGAQRKQLEEWNRLTKKAREEKAADIYENIFEPAIDTARRVKKAEEVGRSRSGLATRNENHEAYKDKLIRLSEEAYLGKKRA